jgi:hypothetical protein
VLQEAGNKHDAETGINLTVIGTIAAIMYPRPSGREEV